MKIPLFVGPDIAQQESSSEVMVCGLWRVIGQNINQVCFQKIQLIMNMNNDRVPTKEEKCVNKYQ